MVETVIEPGELIGVSHDRIDAPPDASARAAYVLRSHFLERVAAALARAGLEALLVKGAALALTVYERPWEREMDDVDLLVRPGTSGRVVEALETIGFVALHPAGRSLSREALGEIPLTATVGGVRVRVEVHTRLDKIVPRPIDYTDVFSRARPAPGYAALLVPSPEDHVLLVALHAAANEFGHMVAFADLALLLASGIDHAVLTARAKQWRLGTAMFMVFGAQHRVTAVAAPERLLAALRPSRVRLATVQCFYRPGQVPVARGRFRLGWWWIIRQTPLRDDTVRWCVGILRYGAVRVVERFFALSGRRPSERPPR